MNNENYGFPNVDTNFSLDLPKSNNEGLQPFQGNIGIDLNFPQHDYSVHSSNYFQQQHNNLTDNPMQNFAFSNNEAPSLNSSALNNQSYYSEFSGQTASTQPFSESLLSSQGHFISNVPQPQEFPSHLEPAEYPSQSNSFSNNSIVPNDCSIIQEPCVGSLGTLSRATFENSSSCSSTLYPHTESNPEASRSDLYPHCEKEVSFANSLPQRPQYTDTDSAALASCDGDSVCEADARQSEEAAPRTNYNEASTTVSSTENTYCDPKVSEVSTVVTQLVSNEEVCLGSQVIDASNDPNSTEVSAVTMEPVSNEDFSLGPQVMTTLSNPISTEVSAVTMEPVSNEDFSLGSPMTNASSNPNSTEVSAVTVEPVSNEDFSLGPQMTNASSNPNSTDVSAVTMEPVSNEDFSLGLQVNEINSENVVDNCEKPYGLSESDDMNINDKEAETAVAIEAEEKSPKPATYKSDELCQTVTADQPIAPICNEEAVAVQPLDENAELSKERTPETLDDISNSLEKGIEASLENSTNYEKVDSDFTNTIELSRPLSPMITVLDGSFDDVEPTVKAEGSPYNNSQDDTSNLNKSAQLQTNVRVTRLRTGALRSKPQRLVVQYDSSDDSSDYSISFEDWNYEEGAEVAASTAYPFVSVPEEVLQVTTEEIAHYVKFFSAGVEGVLQSQLHCTACGKHIGACPNHIHLGNRHKVLRVLICNKCSAFYGAGKFRKDKDGSELYCRWCGQGGQIICCSSCPNVFCKPCITRNFGSIHLNSITQSTDWSCFVCNYKQLWDLRATCWGLLTYTMQKKREALSYNDAKKLRELEDDKSTCCSKQNRKRKLPRSVANCRAGINASQSAPTPQNHLVNDSSVPFGHFLFDDVNLTSAMNPQVAMEGNAGFEEEFIDPSQFVLSVLEEPQPVQTRVLSRPSMPRLSQRQHPPLRPIRPLVSQRVPVPALSITRSAVSLSSGAPRIIIRQGNLMQPGLVPINNQPNSIRVSSTITRPPPRARNSLLNRPQGPPGPQNPRGPLGPQSLHQRQSSRNPPPLILNNIDGVRSMEQLLSLDQVPWFRDGIDSIRALGLALNKRMRELEARFHSLKNKQDVNKVMLLGKKLESLSYKTERRFNYINSNLKGACRNWFMKKTMNIGPRLHPHNSNPFSIYNETSSDWDDDLELSKPLEKVMIPVSTAALQSGTLRPNIQSVLGSSAPPLVNVSTTTAPRGRISPRITLQSTGKPLSSAKRLVGQPLPVLTAFSSANPPTFSRIRRPGPKSSANRYVQIKNNTGNKTSVLRHNIHEAVGTLLNERNGANSVSVSLMSTPKRKRLDSSSSNCSDVMLCPSIPEILKMHNVKTCQVRLERCDDFIESFLAHQNMARNENITVCGVQDASNYECDSVFIPEVETVLSPHCSDIFPEVETVFSSSGISDNAFTDITDTNSTLNKQLNLADNDKDETNNCDSIEDDDDIEIIHEGVI